MHQNWYLIRVQPRECPPNPFTEGHTSPTGIDHFVVAIKIGSRVDLTRAVQKMRDEPEKLVILERRIQSGNAIEDLRHLDTQSRETHRQAYLRKLPPLEHLLLGISTSSLSGVNGDQSSIP